MEYKYLPEIKSPADVKKIPEEKIPELISEIREELIRTVSKNGGHLASNLGVVELSVALHRVFNSPQLSHATSDGIYPDSDEILNSNTDLISKAGFVSLQRKCRQLRSSRRYSSLTTFSGKVFRSTSQKYCARVRFSTDVLNSKNISLTSASFI